MHACNRRPKPACTRALKRPRKQECMQEGSTVSKSHEEASWGAARANEGGRECRDVYTLGTASCMP
eukprot:7275856-Alexandrium_andersonii.AAC.1